MTVVCDLLVYKIKNI